MANIAKSGQWREFDKPRLKMLSALAGEWSKVRMLECTVCGAQFERNKMPFTRHCPNCLATMREGDAE